MTSVPLNDMRIAIVGAGRLGCALALALQQHAVTVVAATTRTPESARAAEARLGVPANTDLKSIGSANVVVIATPDAAIEQVANELAQLPDVPSVVMHMSGCTPLSVLDPLRVLGAEVASIHPVQTFTVDSSASDLAQVPAAVTAETEQAREMAKLIAQAAGLVPFDLADAAKPLHHAACTIAANFTVTLLAAARDLAESSGADASTLLAAYAALAASATKRVSDLGPEAALTGPVARGDWKTVNMHRAAIRSAAPQHCELYDELTASTERLAHQREVAHAID